MTIAPSQERTLGTMGIWPLLILITAALTYPIIEGHPSALQGAASGGWTRLVFFSIAYLLAGVLVLPYFSTVLATVRRMWVYLVLLVLIISSASWSTYPDKVFFNFIHGIGLLLVAASAALYASTRETGFFAPVALVTTGIVVVSALVVYVNPGMGIEPIDPWGVVVQRWRGITSNSNTLGSTAATAICCSLIVSFAHPSRARRLFSLVSIPFSAYVLIIGCKSMTSTVGAIAFVGVFLLLLSMEKDRPGTRWLKLCALGTLTFLGLCMLFLVNPDISLTDLFFKATGRSKTLTGRTLLWQTAMYLIDMKPLLGWSFDSIASARKFLSGTMAYGQFHNGYLDLTVRGGVVGLFLLLLMLIRSIRMGFRQVASNYRKAAGTLALLVFILIVNLAESNFVMEGGPVWFLFVSCWMSAEVQLYLSENAGSGR